MRKAMFVWSVSGAVVASVALACGSGGEEAADPPPAQPAAEPALDCDKVDDALGELILSRPESDVFGELSFVEASAWRSPDFQKVWMVGVRFRVEGVDEPVVGVWASNSLDGEPERLLAVDAFAQEFTDWPDADGTDARISMADPGVYAARSCLGPE